MNIGIYGDSYASANSPQAVKWYELLAKKLETGGPVHQKKSWLSWFKKPKNETFDASTNVNVNVYSFAGSSLFYSYNKFKENCKKNDLNIVMATGPSRYTKSLYLTSTKLTHVITSEPQIDSVINMYGSKLTPADKNRLIFLRGWFKSLDYEYCSEMQELMLQKMESMHNNTIFYPCFSDSFSKERFEKYKLDSEKHQAHTMWHRQLELLNIPMDNFSTQETSNLCGHLGPEFNEYFASVLYKKIKTGEWDHSGLSDVKLQHSLPFYYQVQPHEQTTI